MNLAIFGNDELSHLISDVIKKFYNPFLIQQNQTPINVVAFVDSNNIQGGGEANTPLIDFTEFFSLYSEKNIDGLIIPHHRLTGTTKFLFNLKKFGLNLEDIYFTSRLKKQIDISKFFFKWLEAKYLPYLEYHIADHCNMNCNDCSHYSPLVKNPKFPDFNKFQNDFEQFKKFFDDIGTIRILGGEPLLNPDVGEYVKLTRKLYPDSNILVVTNAILLPQMPEEFFEILRNNKVGIHISFYKPMESKIPKIIKMLQEKNVYVECDRLIENFTISTSLKPMQNIEEIFLNCDEACCNNIYEGKIYTCPVTFATKYFNEYFDKNLPIDGATDLYEEGLTTEKIKRNLTLPFERCRYCVKPSPFVEWKRYSHPSPIKDWIVES